MVSRVRLPSTGRSHCATCSSSAFTLTVSRAAPPCANASISVTSLSSCLRLSAVFAAQCAVSRALRSGRVSCEAYSMAADSGVRI